MVDFESAMKEKWGEEAGLEGGEVTAGRGRLQSPAF